MHRTYLLFLFFGCQLMLAQQKKTLSSVIDYLSKTYDITFSYNTEEVHKVAAIDSFNYNLMDLPKAIQNIENQTGLVIEKVDSSNYIIIKPSHHNSRLICGRIRDLNDNPISFISVALEDQITKTDARGYFYFQVSNQNSIVTIETFGFKPTHIPIHQFNNTCRTIVLEQKIEGLDEVIIKNYMTRGLTKNENGSIKINMKKTGVLPGVIEPDAIQTLQFIPGLQSPDETVTGLHIRGSTPDQNLILYDGVKMYQDTHFFGFLSAFNPYVIDNIQLFRSATKAKYGGHAGGVISIGVDNVIPQKIVAGIGTTLTHANADIKIPIFKNRLAVFASARRGITDFLNTITFQQYSEVAFQNTNISNSFDTAKEISKTHTQFLYEDYFTKLIFKPYPFLQFNFGFVKNQNNLTFTGLNPFFESQTDDDLKIKSSTLYESVSLNSKTFGSHNFQISSTSFNKRYNGLRDFDFTLRQPKLLEITFGKENYVNETSIQYHGKKEVFKNGMLQFGYQRNRSEIAYTADSYGLDLRTFQEFFRGKETSQSFYSDFKYRNKRLHLNFGGRRQFFNRLHDVFWEPRAFINYNLFSNLWIKGSYESKHQSISQITDLRNDGLGELFNRLWVVSTDQSIPIIKNNQIGFGFDFQLQGWTIDLEMYTKKLDGIGILLNDNIFAPRNVSGNNNVKGIDILLKKNWKHYGTWLSYSYMDNEYQFEEINNNNPFQGSFDIPNSIVWAHSLTFENISFSMGYRYRNGIPYTEKNLDPNNPQSNFIIFDTFNGRRLPDYHRLDLTANYNFYLDKTRKLKARLGFTLQNITNTKNVLSRDFRVIERFDPSSDSQLNTPVLRKIDRISLGFTPNFLFRISF